MILSVKASSHISSYNFDKFFVILIFICAPLVDAFTGLLLKFNILSEGSVGSPSQLFRFALLVLGISLLGLLREQLFLIFFFLYGLLIELCAVLAHQNTKGFIVGLINQNKVFLFYLIFLVLSMIIRKNLSYYQDIVKYLFYSIQITSLVVVVSLILHIDMKTYGDGSFGTRGLYASGNGLGLYMGLGVLYTIYVTHVKKYTRLWILLPFTATLLIGTKTAMVFCILSLGYLFYTLSVKAKLISIGIIISLIFFISPFLSDIFSTLFDVVIMRYNNSENLSSFLSSNRDNYLKEAFASISYDGFNLVRILFGSGLFLSFRNPDENLEVLDTLENDFGDIYFSFGLIGVSLYLFIYIMGMVIGYKQGHRLLLLLFTLWFFHSLFAGHALFNGMSGLYLPVLFVLLKYPSKLLESKAT